MEMLMKNKVEENGFSLVNMEMMNATEIYWKLVHKTN